MRIKELRFCGEEAEQTAEMAAARFLCGVVVALACVALLTVKGEEEKLSSHEEVAVIKNDESAQGQRDLPQNVRQNG